MMCLFCGTKPKLNQTNKKKTQHSTVKDLTFIAISVLYLILYISCADYCIASFSWGKGFR